MNFILLAAGHGQRMGVNKALMLYKGEPWILHQVRSLMSLELQNITIVTNAESESGIRIALSLIPEKIDILVNPHPENGPFSSLQMAIASTPDGPSFVCPVDVPFKTSTLRRLRQAWIQHGHLDALIPLFKDQGGHPVILSLDLQRSILKIPQNREDARLDFILRALPENKKRTHLMKDPLVVLNLNTPEDLERLTSPT